MARSVKLNGWQILAIEEALKAFPVGDATRSSMANLLAIIGRASAITVREG